MSEKKFVGIMKNIAWLIAILQIITGAEFIEVVLAIIAAVLTEIWYEVLDD